MGKPLTEQQFNTIKAQLRKKSNEIAKVAEASGLKVSTIRVVRRTDTWKQYQALRKAQGEKIKALHKLDKITRANQTLQVQPLIQKIKPGTSHINGTKVLNSPVTKITDESAAPKKRVNAKPSKSATQISKETFDAMGLQLVSLTERLVTLEVALRKLQHDAIKSDIQGRRTFMARFRRGQR